MSQKQVPKRMSNVGEQVSKTVESAKETVAKAGEAVSDFFQGNPFSTPVGRKIELATDANVLATENWGLNMEICDFINGHEDGARDAVRAIKKRLQSNMSRNNAVVMYTLTVLETCVKNCDRRFHFLVCSKDFAQEMVKLIGSKFDAPQIIQERVLGLIQAWADAFRSDPDLQGVVQVYEDLKGKGVLFPASDLDSLAPIKTPKRTVFTTPAPVAPAPSAYQQVNYDVLPIREQGQEPINATPEQLTKLRADLDIVNGNLKVFREALADIVPRKETGDELQLLADLYASCKKMQQRVLDLIRYLSNEEVTYELLMLNDSFNNTFEKYERYMANRQKEEGAAPPVGHASVGDLIDIGQEHRSLGEQLSALKVSSANGSIGGATSSSSKDTYKANSEPQAGVGLAQAVHAKIPTDNEAAEMAQWLEVQEKPKPKTKEEEENEKL
ncbi:unnamed protein product [Caenorhabditis auriculariae]|uniref:VHS domain-containing protein n=1 Tax=Caenorhabditis auriculariae TaxID=2777116 RepID=A0A8S1H0F4_9PELO|nr:unnamed protein product [Caenorhabditis auriculariae]